MSSMGVQEINPPLALKTKRKRKRKKKNQSAALQEPKKESITGARSTDKNQAKKSENKKKKNQSAALQEPKKESITGARSTDKNQAKKSENKIQTSNKVKKAAPKKATSAHNPTVTTVQSTPKKNPKKIVKQEKKRQEIQLAPSDIFYSQCSISNTFSSGGKIGELLDDIVFGRCFISAVPIIEVCKIDGKWYSADNRRLWVIKQLDILGRVTTVKVKVMKRIFSGKMTTKNEGKTVDIRKGHPGGQIYDLFLNQENINTIPEESDDDSMTTPDMRTQTSGDQDMVQSDLECDSSGLTHQHYENSFCDRDSDVFENDFDEANDNFWYYDSDDNDDDYEEEDEADNEYVDNSRNSVLFHNNGFVDVEHNLEAQYGDENNEIYAEDTVAVLRQQKPVSSSNVLPYQDGATAKKSVGNIEAQSRYQRQNYGAVVPVSSDTEHLQKHHYCTNASVDPNKFSTDRGFPSHERQGSHRNDIASERIVVSKMQGYFHTAYTKPRSMFQQIPCYPDALTCASTVRDSNTPMYTRYTSNTGRSSRNETNSGFDNVQPRIQPSMSPPDHTPRSSARGPFRGYDQPASIFWEPYIPTSEDNRASTSVHNAFSRVDEPYGTAVVNPRAEIPRHEKISPTVVGNTGLKQQQKSKEKSTCTIL